MEGLAFYPALAEIGVDRQGPFRQRTGLAPPSARRLAFLAAILSAAKDRHRDRLFSFVEGPLDFPKSAIVDVAGEIEIDFRATSRTAPLY